MAKIRKAVITAAGNRQQTLPVQTLVDRDGETKSVLRIIVDEVIRAGIEEIAVIVRPNTQETYRSAAGDAGKQLSFIEQENSEGYAHAVYCSRDFLKSDPFLHLVGDHLYVSAKAKDCAKQLVDVAEAENCSVSAVQATREFNLPYYGTIGGQRLADKKNIYRIDDVVEKPTPTEAEQRLVVPGLRAGSYLCFFGMHVFTPLVIDLLTHRFEVSEQKPPRYLSHVLAELAKQEKYLACEVAGSRHEIAAKYGLFNAQLALAMESNDRNEILSTIVDSLATRQIHHDK
ncbi:sugar phosphate nucleotidyltransferase [Verrucomicrobia bacterium]|jgi:UTP--glucose-1-phosphate uridylyltransferase|nr:UTP--glucose-1-phosphate uridylyltransferase [Verrucomicrobiota bacterium]MDA7510246.1 sugar phosphate nucleotidyltransferase [Verrucomicrobiota bacterium]MDA7667852.1 sugar phosphate nucleotidyltransferase [bacterium]MDA7866440.1 sugar phosphate nucleotidyltransferase [Verrucomicrobiota bacterium]MDB4746251.1 sugar phosphate nucleotidyltransferase [Verrucomicrobiota bacterium]